MGRSEAAVTLDPRWHLKSSMYVAALWRYPVKSMAGEPLSRVEVSASGLAGDRIVQVYRANGRVATARTCPGLLGHRATLDVSGEPLVDGRPWKDPRVLDDVRRHVEPGATLARDEADDRFDILPLLVATDGAIAAFGRDARRLRPNLVIGGVEGLAERAWPGHELRIGDVRIGIQSLRGRCVMTTFDPDTLAQDPEVLRDIVKRFAGRLALDCFVIQGGEIAVGQPVELAASNRPFAMSQADASGISTNAPAWAGERSSRWPNTSSASFPVASLP
jgi:uncharacterized protein